MLERMRGDLVRGTGTAQGCIEKLLISQEGQLALPNKVNATEAPFVPW